MTNLQMDLWKHRVEEVWMPFPEARAIARSRGFEYEDDWIAGIAEGNVPGHPGVPPNPEFIYRHTGWNGWKDWLIYPGKQVQYPLYPQAQEFVWCLGLPDEQAWIRYIRDEEPLHASMGLMVPARPFLEYRGQGWLDWDDWLGTKMVFRNFGETRKFVRTLRLKSREEWTLYCKGRLTRPLRKPAVIYSYPEIAFRNNGWLGWEDWLGMD